MKPITNLTCIVSLIFIHAASQVSALDPLKIDQDKLMWVGRKVTVERGSPACKSYYKLQDISAIRDSGDHKAAVAFMNDESNGCIVTRKGVVAYVQQMRERRPSSQETSAVCIRPEGLTGCLWLDQFHVTAHYD